MFKLSLLYNLLLGCFKYFYWSNYLWYLYSHATAIWKGTISIFFIGIYVSWININYCRCRKINGTWRNTTGKIIRKRSYLTIPYGETIAFVGPSGEGKTTLIRLILALINPSSGKVYLKENNKKDSFNRDYRNLISYVPQGNTLFSGTIEDNLRYGNFEATEEEIYEALKNACALDFVNELENGIKTVIGEKATGISEGQAQRIAIARSFLRKKPILILDEATSALDPETEVKVLKAVKSLPHKPTCIIITHRPSALNICHRIIRLEKGHLKQVSKESILEVATELV